MSGTVWPAVVPLLILVLLNSIGTQVAGSDAQVPIVPKPSRAQLGSRTLSLVPFKAFGTGDGNNGSVVFCTVESCEDVEVDETGAGGGYNELEFDTTAVKCWSNPACSGVLLRAMKRVRSRLQRGVEPGVTLPYLSVRYPPRKRSSSADYGDIVKAFTKLRLETSQEHADLPSLNTDESYSLVLGDTGEGTLSAATLTGLLRGLESFIQLVRYDGAQWVIPHLPLRIEDSPRFSWRGLLLDSARHFLPVASVLRTLDGMAAMKLNVLHWHLTDAQAFTIQLESHPELAQQGALHPQLSYSKAEIRHVVAYARDRGIRVVPELDVPGHTASWGLAHPELIVHCDEITHGQDLSGSVNRVAMHPTKQEVWAVLTDVLTEIATLFPDEYMHLGGDEVDARCWQADPELQELMRNRGIDTRVLQSEFTSRIVGLAQSLGKKVVLWEEAYDAGKGSGATRLDNSVVVNVWHNRRLVRGAARDGHNVVVSWGAYLDRYNPTDSGGHWAYFDTWTDMYNRLLTAFPPAPSGNFILGGEASSWGESVDAVNSDERVFSRLPPVAERLWHSGPNSSSDEDNMRTRMAEFRCAMVRGLGIAAGPVMPDYCDVSVKL